MTTVPSFQPEEVISALSSMGLDPSIAEVERVIARLDMSQVDQTLDRQQQVLQAVTRARESKERLFQFNDGDPSAQTVWMLASTDRKIIVAMREGAEGGWEELSGSDLEFVRSQFERDTFFGQEDLESWPGFRYVNSEAEFRDSFLEAVLPANEAGELKLAVVPVAVQNHVTFVLNALRDHEFALAGVQRARGNGHILALEIADRAEKIAQFQQQLNDFRALAAKNGVDAEVVITKAGGEPDFSRFGGPSATGGKPDGKKPDNREITATLDGSDGPEVITFSVSAVLDHHTSKSIREWDDLDALDQRHFAEDYAHSVYHSKRGEYAQSVDVELPSSALKVDVVTPSKRELQKESDKQQYMLLGRLQQDCDYYLGAGNRSKKHLWATDENGQIQKMKEIYNQLQEKPEWLTLAQIEQYEQKMLQDPNCTVGPRESLEDLQKVAGMNLPGVWEDIGDGYFTKTFAEGAGYLEAHVVENKWLIQAKTSSLVGGYMHAVQSMGERRIATDDYARLVQAVAELETAITTGTPAPAQNEPSANTAQRKDRDNSPSFDM